MSAEPHDAHALMNDSGGDPGTPVGPSRPPQAWERGPITGWRPWTAPAALAGAFVLALVGGLLVEIPAQILGAHITPSHVPGGVELAATVIQDIAFVLVALFFAQLGGRALMLWHLGLRYPRVPTQRVAVLAVATLGAFIVFGIVWNLALQVTEKEKLLETLGANEGTALLILSAGLTCILAPVAEEILFRGYIFGALSNWRGPWPAALITGLLFGAVHAGSAPVLDLVPLAVLGVFLCLLYRATGSLYPCIGVHALNNAIAFGQLEHWSLGEVATLVVVAGGALALVGAILTAHGVIGSEQEDADVLPEVRDTPST
ncbi:MAG: CPBP family intramembrane glutamic endopeptidase [Solirubrobacteraceae bacterium]